MFFGRNDAKAETPIIWPPDVKNWLIWKDPDAGKDWGHEEKGTTEDEMIGWHHWLNGHGFGKLRELITDREAWCAVVYGVTKFWTWLSDWTELNVDLDKLINWGKLNIIKKILFGNSRGTATQDIQSGKSLHGLRWVFLMGNKCKGWKGEWDGGVGEFIESLLKVKKKKKKKETIF